MTVLAYHGGPKQGWLYSSSRWLDGLKIQIVWGPRARHQWQERKAQRALRREGRRAARRSRGR